MKRKKFKTEAEAKQFISSNPYSLGPVNKKGAFFVGVSKVNELCIKTVGMTNEYYKMNVHLAIDPAVGLNWRDCH